MAKGDDTPIIPKKQLDIFVVNKHNEPVANAFVNLGDYQGFTNLNGHIRFSNASAGLTKILVIVEKEGYETYSKEYPVHEHGVVITLTLQEIELGYGIVRRNEKAILDDRGHILQVGISFFWYLWGLKFDRDRTIQNLDTVHTHEFDAIRILCSVSDNPDFGWSDRPISPEWSATQLADGLNELKKRGMRAIVCIFGDVHSSTDTKEKRLQFVQDIVAVCNNFKEQILYLSVSNEGIGFPEKDDDPEILDLTAWIRAHTNFLVSSVAKKEDHTASVYAARTERDISGDGGVWEHTEKPYDFKSLDFVVSDDEPIGPKSSVHEDSDPLRNAMHMACAFVNRFAIYVYHTGAGIRGGGAADLARGRKANFFDEPELVGFSRMMHSVRTLFPGSLPLWSEIAHSNPSNQGRYPFDTGVLQPFDPSNWFLKTYSNKKGVNFACIFLKVEKDIPLKAIANCEITIDNLRGSFRTQNLSIGQTHVVTSRGGFVVVGKFI